MSLLQHYQKIYSHVNTLAKNCGRNPDEIQIIAVSKGCDSKDIQTVYDAGCCSFGESRLQEALPKIAKAPSNTNWHFIGPLQKNKVLKVINLFDLIHSVDSLELAHKISLCSQEIDKITSVLLQVNISGEKSKQGLSPKQLLATFTEFASLPSVKIEGLMTMAPLTDDDGVIRKSFRDLRLLRNELGLKHLSMGMSHDYPIAIEEGATLLRIGSAIFGKRNN